MSSNLIQLWPPEPKHFSNIWRGTWSSWFMNLNHFIRIHHNGVHWRKVSVSMYVCTFYPLHGYIIIKPLVLYDTNYGWNFTSFRAVQQTKQLLNQRTIIVCWSIAILLPQNISWLHLYMRGSLLKAYIMHVSVQYTLI